MALLSFDGDNAYKKYAETSISKKFKLVPIESIKIEGGEVSDDDANLLAFLLGSFGSFTLDICGDIYSGLKFSLDDDGVTLTLGDVEKYGVCIRFTPDEFGNTIYSCELNPKKYGKDLNASYYLRVYAEVSGLDVTNDYRFLVDRKRAIEYGEDTNLIAAKPYIEETYDTHGNLIGAKLYGHTKIRNHAFSGCTNLALTSLPEGLKSIGDNAFQNCTSLTSITFKGTPTTIVSSVFPGCTNLTEIKVPWSEGKVANAPWGATNATITYNYTGE